MSPERRKPISCEDTGILTGSGNAFADLGLPDAPELVSGAGHDAMVLAAAGVPAAMLFVRSLTGGISHSPDELSSAEDIELAVAALTAVLGRLAR